MRLSIEVEVRRGPIVECRHRIQAAVTDAQGTLHAGTGQPELVTTFRSAAKPFQLLPLVERGHAARWDFRDEELAIMAASHTGSADHLGLVRGILARLGLEEEHLACGYHDPLDPEQLEHVRHHPASRTAIYNNCSGKHAGMLAFARSEGWPVEGYHRAEHPVQQAMLRTVAECCGVATRDVATGIDGCGVVVFAVPLQAMARGFARLASADAASAEPREQALARIRAAMQAFPQATGGRARFSTALMEAAEGRLVAKGGAEGLECIGVPGRKLGLAIKVEDGATRAVAPAVIALLETLELLPAQSLASLASWRKAIFHNAAGLEVGHLEPVLRVTAPALG